MFKKVATKPAPVAVPLTPLNDRVKNSEAMVLSFTAQHSLAFSLTPHIIDLAKALANDKKALDEMSVDRTSASYKLKYGVAKTVKDKLVSDLQNNYFSLNIDEATSNNINRVVTVLVSYFSPEKKQVVVHHLESFSVVKVNSETMYNALVDLFERHQLPCSNLMSILMDSCAVMRGSKTGLETRIRQNKAPHLLDIDGDTCHHAHNASKGFCKPFKYFVEGLFSDLHTDFHWSTDIRDYFHSICLILGVKFTIPQRYVSHRWLSVYDVCIDSLRLLDAYTIFYYAFLPTDMQTVYLSRVLDVHRKYSLSNHSRSSIRDVRTELQKKNKTMTAEGKARKGRIVEKLFYLRKKTLMIMNLYSAVLPLLKKYVMLFQAKEPLMHKLHDQQTELLKDFLSCFVKPECISGASSRKLKEIDVRKRANQLENGSLLVGHGNKIVLNELKKDDEMAKEFIRDTRSAYENCAGILQTKMPVNNQLLKSISAIDPLCRGHSLTLKYLCKLPTLITNVFENEEISQFDIEARQFQIDDNLPDSEDKRIDCWWAEIESQKKYPTLCQLVKPILSCFHGPQVESSFNVMGDIIDTKSPSMHINTYSAIQTVKYELRQKEKTAVQYYYKKDPVHDPVDSSLVSNLQRSYKTYEQHKAEDRAILEKKKTELGARKVGTLLTKRKSKELYIAAAKKARLVHQKKVAKCAKSS